MRVAAAAVPMLMPFLHPPLSCIALSLLLAKLLCHRAAFSLVRELVHRAAAWVATSSVAAHAAALGRDVTVLLAEDHGSLFRRAASEAGEEGEELEGEHVQCAVCLCGVREGQDGDASRLRCGHVFHRACVGRWVGQRRSTCPLCRAYLPPPDAAHQDEAAGVETILVAPFSFSDEREDAGTWWLR